MNPTTREQGEPKLFTQGNTLPFVLVTALFFLWGIPNNLNDVLIKQFMKSFEMSRFQAGLIQSAFYMGYFLLSMPAALIMKKYSYKNGPRDWAASLQRRHTAFFGLPRSAGNTASSCSRSS